MLQRLPGHSFILVGDTGQADPEIYGDLARQFPPRVQRVAIRIPITRPGDAARLQQAFKNVPAHKWHADTDLAALRRFISAATSK